MQNGFGLTIFAAIRMMVSLIVFIGYLLFAGKGWCAFLDKSGHSFRSVLR